jgi:hypothetical protein
MSLETEVAGGVELGPFSLKALAGIAAGIDTMNKRLHNIAKREESYQFGAVEVMLRGSCVSATTGNLIMCLDGPSYGRLWEVKRLTVGGALWTSTVGGQAIVVLSPASGQVTPATSDVADQAASLPSVAYYSTRQLTVRHPNRLYVVILSPTASTQYAVGGQATDLPDKRVSIDVEA